MTTTTTRQDGHTVTVVTEKNSFGNRSTSTTYVDGKATSAVSHDPTTGKTDAYTSVSSGILGTTNSGTFKK